MESFDLVVVGAGPAGLMAAIRAGERGAKVLILEKMKQAGRKLLITGNGRCNICNTSPISEFIKHVYPDGKFLKPAFSQFYSKDIRELLHRNGVRTVTEKEFKVFPESDKASDVLDTLIFESRKNGAELRLNSKVEQLLSSEGRIKGIRYSSNDKEYQIKTNNVVVATGGCSYPRTGSTGDGYHLAKNLGIKIVAPSPALVPLITEGQMAEKLQGLAIQNVKAVLWIDGKKAKQITSELMFTHFGLSGPGILVLSREAARLVDLGRSVEISIDVQPDTDDQELDKSLQNEINKHGKKLIANLCKHWMPGKLGQVALEVAGIDPSKEAHQISAKERKKIRQTIKDFRFKITGHQGYREAIITTGGIALSEISKKSLQSNKVKGLFFAGEVMDLDADTGGYNLQIAFSTGWLAGNSVLVANS